jgi:hypothetical protein
MVVLSGQKHQGVSVRNPQGGAGNRASGDGIPGIRIRGGRLSGQNIRISEKDRPSQEFIRDDAQRHSRIFGMAVIFLQVAILLSSIAALLKKKSVWILGLLIGAVGMMYFLNGFLLFME